MEVQALASRGWSVSAIARHLDRDRKTVRAYMRGERQAGARAGAAPDPLAPFEGYIRARRVTSVAELSRLGPGRSWCESL